MWNPYCFVNITSEKRVIDSDKRYTNSHKKGQEIEKKEGLNSGDGFKLGISMEVVEVEPEITPEELLEQAKLEAQQIISEDEILTAQSEDIRALADLVEAVLEEGSFCVIGNENAIRKEEHLFMNIRNLN